MKTDRTAALFATLENGEVEEFKRLLLKERSLQRKRNPDSRTLLHISAMQGNEELSQVRSLQKLERFPSSHSNSTYSSLSTKGGVS